MASYCLITHWHIEAPLHGVYEAVFHSLEWPGWWRGVVLVQECEAGGEDGIGSVRRYIWKGRLPYRMRFDARVTRIESMSMLEATVTGDLEGMGRWLFSQSGTITTVRYEWQVRTTRPWMNLLAPLARFAFRKNHDALMQHGAEGLAHLLNARLVAVSHSDLPPGPASSMQYANH